MKWTVCDGVTLRAFLARQLPLPEYRIKALMEKGLVRVDETPARKDQPLQPGMAVEARLPRSFLPKVPVLFEGQDYLVVEKPRGIEVCDSETGALTMEDTLHLMGYENAVPCHRLDTHTGGVMLFARGKQAESAARILFSSHELRKKYLAVCIGTPKNPSADVKAYLIRQGGKSIILQHSRPGALPIETRYRILSRKEGLSFAEIELVTGRTHQIRAHFASWGCPLLGDDLYGQREFNRIWKVRYPCLWAESLTFPNHSEGPLAELSGLTFSSSPQFPEKLRTLFFEQ